MNTGFPAPYRLGNGYIGLPVVVRSDKLPKKIEINGTELLLKTELHVSLLAVKTLEPQQQETACNLFTEYVTARPITFSGFVNEFRHAIKDDKESLVVRCTTANLEGFFEQLRVSGVVILSQPTHITLYTREPNKGIGINSEEEMRAYPVVEFPGLFATLTA